MIEKSILNKFLDLIKDWEEDMHKKEQEKYGGQEIIIEDLVLSEEFFKELEKKNKFEERAKEYYLSLQPEEADDILALYYLGKTYCSSEGNPMDIYKSLKRGSFIKNDKEIIFLDLLSKPNISENIERATSLLKE